MKLCVLVLMLRLMSVPGGGAQKGEPDIQKYINRINEGEVQQVREQLPALLSKYPNHPGALYVQALLTREGAEAVRIYLSIVDNFPQSEWADDAVYKTYQFYYSLGLYRTAELKMNQLKTQYPSSPYLRETAGTSAPPKDDNEQLVPQEPRQGVQQEPRQEVQQEPRQEVPQESRQEVPQEPRQEVPQEPRQEVPQEPRQGVQQEPRQGVPQEPRQGVEKQPVAQSDPIPVRFSLQVGAFTVQANAEAQKNRFELLGYTAELISKVKDTRSLFTVLVGDYQTYDEAKAAGREVKRKLGIDLIVISR
jgi:cell division protein FtsN